MLASVALALLAAQSLPLRLAPAPNGVVTFAYALSYAGSDPQVSAVDSLADMAPIRWQVAERATPQGANILLTRYVAFVNTVTPATAVAALSDAPPVETTPRTPPDALVTMIRLQAGARAGKTYRYLLSPLNRAVPRKLERYENAPKDLPSLDLSLPSEPLVPGFSWATEIGAAGRPTTARATVREFRPLPNGDTAVVLDLAPTDTRPGDPAILPKSYAVLCARDGRYLLGRIVVSNGGPSSTLRSIIEVQRVNAPGLARLKADLGFDR